MATATQQQGQGQQHDQHAPEQHAHEQHLDLAAVVKKAEEVPDPELPVVTLGDLGIIRGAAVAPDGAVEVAITPTYVGCPATEAIAKDVREAVAELCAPREVRTLTVLAPAWSTDWISDSGRRKLAEHGIAPPSGTRAVQSGPVPVELSVRCPRCASTDTRLISRFGSTPCQSLRACRSCGEPFGAVKPL
jgi:ring-1,2-phenylacetyl-CoA epoxidase subunit PaaD